jgi:hypothetical protein
MLLDVLSFGHRQHAVVDRLLAMSLALTPAKVMAPAVTNDAHSGLRRRHRWHAGGIPLLTPPGARRRRRKPHLVAASPARPLHAEPVRAGKRFGQQAGARAVGAPASCA